MHGCRADSGEWHHVRSGFKKARAPTDTSSAYRFDVHSARPMQMTPYTTLDEYTMSAFISGTLSAEQRKSVLSCLLKDEDARDWLHMACEALAVALHKDAPTPWLNLAVRPPVRGADRPSRRPGPHSRSVF